jgi:hypothetical protein
MSPRPVQHLTVRVVGSLVLLAVILFVAAIQPPTAHAICGLDFELTPASGPPGTVVQVRSSGLNCLGGTVNLYWDTEQNRVAQTPGNSTWSTSFTVPQGASPGAHMVLGVHLGLQGGCSPSNTQCRNSRQFTVTSPTGGSPGGQQPSSCPPRPIPFGQGIQSGQSLRGFICPADSQDVLTFGGNAGDAAVVTMAAEASLVPWLQIHSCCDNTGGLLVEDRSGARTATVRLTLPYSGTYAIRAGLLNFASTGPYTITLQLTPRTQPAPPPPPQPQPSPVQPAPAPAPAPVDSA